MVKLSFKLTVECHETVSFDREGGGGVTWGLNCELCIVMIFSLFAMGGTYDVTHVLLEFQIRKRVFWFFVFF